MSLLLTEIVNSFEKLDLVVYLHRLGYTAPPASTIGTHLALAPKVVAEALAGLYRAGVIGTRKQDGGGWSIDRAGPWSDTIDVLVALYEVDRAALLDLMRHSAFDAARIPWSARPGKRSLPS